MKSKYKFGLKDFKTIGLYDANIVKVASKTVQKLLQQKAYKKEELIEILKDVLQNPDKYEATPFSILAETIVNFKPQNDIKTVEKKIKELKKEIITYPIYGKELIEKGAIEQMNAAMRLPVSLAGALMPDTHLGYGLPVGGVLATQNNAVIPFAVGVDIACRMCMSIFEIDASFLEKNQNKFKNLLLKNTCFGTGKGFEKPMEDEIFEKDIWNSSKLLKSLKGKAIAQIGSSGTGNHFVEWGVLTIFDDKNDLNLAKGKYLSLLSHSGSRGLGANIAGHYSNLAMETTLLPNEVKHLAWLDLDTEEGQEYWIGMTLAGEYAAANHHHIHKKMAKDLEKQPVMMIENHHNFAWKEKMEDGTEVIVHRKGATPAHKGEWGIIPASMAQAGYLIKGRGIAASLNSASHGAGRLFSRGRAMKSITHNDLQQVLNENGVLLIGGDVDEAPMAYKDIDTVMHAQEELVEIVAKFNPKIVRMAERERFGKGKKDKFEES